MVGYTTRRLRIIETYTEITEANYIGSAKYCVLCGKSHEGITFYLCGKCPVPLDQRGKGVSHMYCHACYGDHSRHAGLLEEAIPWWEQTTFEESL